MRQYNSAVYIGHLPEHCCYILLYNIKSGVKQGIPFQANKYLTFEINTIPYFGLSACLPYSLTTVTRLEAKLQSARSPENEVAENRVYRLSIWLLL